MGFFSRVAKALAVTLIAATGIGIFYLLSKTQVINEGFRGFSYDRGKLKVLEPGIHILLSPLHIFDKTIPIEKDVVVRLDKFEIKTADSVPAMVQADFTFRITDPKKAILNVGNYEEAIKETVKAAISSILQEQRYDQLNLGFASSSKKLSTTNTFSELKTEINAEEEKSVMSKPSINSITTPSTQISTQIDPLSDTSTIFDKMKQAVNAICNKWGISISRMRLISVDAKDTRISQEIAETALSHLRASNQLVAAHAKAKTLRIEAAAEAQAKTQIATGEAEALMTMTKAKVNAVKYAAKKLSSSSEKNMYRLQVGLNAAQALGATTGTVVLGNNAFPFFNQNKTQNNNSLNSQTGNLARSASMSRLQ